MSTKTEATVKTKKVQWFWTWVIGSVILRLILVYFPKNLNLSSRPEVSTPLTSIRRRKLFLSHRLNSIITVLSFIHFNCSYFAVAEGYWLKQSSMSPYAGSMYHGSPLLLTLLGPLTVTKIEGQPDHLLCSKYQLISGYSLVFVMADVVTAMLICAAGKKLQVAYGSSLQSVGLHQLSQDSDILPSGDFAALVYLWNPFTIVACVGLSTSVIENLMIVLTLYGACTRVAPLAAFGWVIATHLSLYPAILIIPVVLLFGYGPDAPPRKLFLQRKNLEVDDSNSSDRNFFEDELVNKKRMLKVFSWRPVGLFLFWALLWSSYVLILCGIYVQQHGGLQEMFKRFYLIAMAIICF
ncbi:hypothetical protein KIW84_042065 [Lathyrus oleraceus]|uniref:GPI transamidase subunit PIG-U n=1 Tax=Pisum sativum TaxID=3888 RepID=A0A9D4XBW4_PEA|nr:hypothetical protein KIW84_042065 [Pisum sativum]